MLDRGEIEISRGIIKRAIPGNLIVVIIHSWIRGKLTKLTKLANIAAQMRKTWNSFITEYVSSDFMVQIYPQKPMQSLLYCRVF